MTVKNPSLIFAESVGDEHITDAVGSQCLNCKERKSEVADNNGHCDACAKVVSSYDFTFKQLAEAAGNVVALNLHDESFGTDAVYRLARAAGRYGLEVVGRESLQDVA